MIEPVAACGLLTCPVPRPTATVVARLQSSVIPAGSVCERGHRVEHPDPTMFVPGAGDTRFAPLDGAAHVYLARTRFAALLESALHEAAPPEPRIYLAQLDRWMASSVSLDRSVRLVDLRDHQLERLGLARTELVATTPTHFPCTREWAEVLRGRAIGGQPTHGIVWHSRQRELHTFVLGHRPALRDLVDEVPAEVMVLWDPPVGGALLSEADGGLGPLSEGEGLAYVDDLATVLDIPVIE